MGDNDLPESWIGKPCETCGEQATLAVRDFLTWENLRTGQVEHAPDGPYHFYCPACNREPYKRRVGYIPGYAVRLALNLKREHADTWRNRPEGYWFGSLVAEVGTLGLILAGGTGITAEEQLARIASIAMNWMEMRQGGEVE